MRESRCGLLSLSVSVIAVVQLSHISVSKAQNAPPPGQPEVNYQGNNVAPPPPPGPPGPPGPPPGYASGPFVSVNSDSPRARLQVMGPLKWQDVCVTPCNVPVNPQGLYRIGGGSIRPSETFSMPRPSGRVVIDTQVGSTVKHWVGVGLLIGGIASAAVGGLYYAGADDISSSSSGTTTTDTAHAIGIVYIVTGLILLAVGIPLSMSSTSVDVH